MLRRIAVGEKARAYNAATHGQYLHTTGLYADGLMFLLMCDFPGEARVVLAFVDGPNILGAIGGFAQEVPAGAEEGPGRLHPIF